MSGPVPHPTLTRAPQSGRVIIVGGGFSGLTLAFELLKHNISSVVFERDRWGGLISTEQLPEMQVESAANGFLNSEAVEDLCLEIGCDLQGVQRAGKKRFIYRKGLRSWPLSLKSTAMIFFKVLPQFIFCKSRIKPRDFESVRDWSLRVLNLEVLERLLSPVLQGIYAGDVSELSAGLIFKKAFEPFARQRRKLRFRGTVAPRNGMGHFVSTLKSYLQGHGVVLNLLGSDEKIQVRNDEMLVLATSPWDLPDALKQIEFSEKFPASEIKQAQETVQHFQSVQSLPLLRVTVSYSPGCYQLPGFGLLFPKCDDFNTLGVLANSQIFANRGDLYNESWIVDGRNLHLTDQQVIKLIQSDRQRAFGVEDSIRTYKVVRWSRAISKYSVVHEKLLAQYLSKTHLESRRQFFLTGNYLGNLGLAKILEQNNKIAQEIAVERSR